MKNCILFYVRRKTMESQAALKGHFRQTGLPCKTVAGGAFPSRNCKIQDREGAGFPVHRMDCLSLPMARASGFTARMKAPNLQPGDRLPVALSPVTSDMKISQVVFLRESRVSFVGDAERSGRRCWF